MAKDYDFCVMCYGYALYFGYDGEDDLKAQIKEYVAAGYVSDEVIEKYVAVWLE